MDLFNQNYHIQIHMCISCNLKNKKQKHGVQERFYGKTISEYI